MTNSTNSVIDHALEILRSTQDGDKLSPVDLSLVESAVNGWLSETGDMALQQLLYRVRRGYRPQWLHEIEHLTIDHKGFVYWKGQEVEHYNIYWAYSLEAKPQALELARRCRHLETIGVPVNTPNAISRWVQHSARK